MFFQGNRQSGYGPLFLATGFILGLTTASFYGWLPLYLPELFPTRIRATAQGFAFNFGRTLAAAGTLLSGRLLDVFKEDYAKMASVITLIATSAGLHASSAARTFFSCFSA